MVETNKIILTRTAHHDQLASNQSIQMMAEQLWTFSAQQIRSHAVSLLLSFFAFNY